MPDKTKTVDAQGYHPRTKLDRALGSSDWLRQCARLPGKSMHLAVALELFANTQGTRRVVIGNLACEPFGLTRNSKYRALRSLEKAGLVAVERKSGRSPIVVILDGPA